MSNDNGQPNIPQARARLHQPAEDIDPDFDDVAGGAQDNIQKGMPGRNLKMALSGLVVLALLAYLLYPKSPSKPAVEPPAPTPTAPGNLVNELVQARPDPVITVPTPPVTSPPVSPLVLPSQTQNTPSLDDERKLAALLASTDSADVTLRSKVLTTTVSNPDDIASLLKDQQVKAEKMMKESQDFAQRIANGAAQSTTLPVEAPARSSHAQFLATQSNAGALGPAVQLDAARTRPTLYEGTIIRTVLTRALKTDLPGMVTAKVTTDLYDTLSQRILLVPRGSEITCNYQSELMVGQELVLAACNRMRLPNGKSFSLNAATASDMQGASGLPAEINNHFLKMFKTALIVGVASKFLPSEDRQVTVTEGSTGNVSTGGTLLGTTINKIIEATLARNIIIPPTGTVNIGTPFTLTISRDVELEPYLR